VAGSRSTAINSSIRGDYKTRPEEVLHIVYVLLAGGTEESAKLLRIVREVTVGFVQSYDMGEGIPAWALGPEKQKGDGIMTVDNI